MKNKLNYYYHHYIQSRWDLSMHVPPIENTHTENRVSGTNQYAKQNVGRKQYYNSRNKQSWTNVPETGRNSGLTFAAHIYSRRRKDDGFYEMCKWSEWSAIASNTTAVVLLKQSLNNHFVLMTETSIRNTAPVTAIKFNSPCFGRFISTTTRLFMSLKCTAYKIWAEQ